MTKYYLLINATSENYVTNITGANATALEDNATQIRNTENASELLHQLSSNTTYNDDNGVGLHYILGVATLLVSVMTVIGNGSLLWVILKTSLLRTVTNSFIVSLAVSDLIVGFLIMPYCAAALFKDEWPFSQGFCEMTGFIGNLCSIAAVLNLMMVSIDRCVAVSLPLKYSYRLPPGVACFMLILVWVFALIFASMPVFGWGEYEYISPAMTCVLHWRKDSIYLATRYVTCTLIPGAVIATMFLLILKAAHAQRRVFAIMPLPVGLALATSLGPTPSVNYRRTTLQAMRMLFMIVGVLAILWAPYTIVKIIDLQTSGNVPFALLRTCAWISLLSSAVNPIIFLNNKKYNSRFKALLCSCSPARGHGNRVWPADGNTATQHTLSTALPSFADFPSTSGLFTPRLKRKSTSFIGSNLNTLEIPPLKSAASVPIIKFNPPIVTITPSTPVHEGKGKISAKSPAKTVDAITGLNVKAEIPTTPVHSMKYTKKDPLGDIENLYDVKFL